MKFIPCQSGQCTEGGTHCGGCGRSHSEIAETKYLVGNIVEFSRKQGYENVDDFAAFIHKNLLKKLNE
jgi:hypothetical protein